LGNLFKAKLTLVFRNSLKIDRLKFDLLEENFPISHFQNPKLTTTRKCDTIEFHSTFIVPIKSIPRGEGYFEKYMGCPG
jgi:hypothetical protein